MSTSTLASLIVRLAADTGEFVTDIGRAAKISEQRAKQIEEQFTAMGTAIGAAAVAAAGAIAVAVKQSIDEFDNLAKTSQKIGTTVESLSTLAYAAEQSGVELGTLQSAMTRLASAAGNAASGNASALATFRALGIEVRDAAGNVKTTDTLLREAADRFKSYANNSQEAALAVKLFGRSGAELLPLLNAGSDGIKELEERARALGLEIGTEAAQQAEIFNDNMADLGKLVKGFANDVATQVLPNLASLSSYLADSGIKARDAAGGTNWLADAIKTSINVFIAFKTAIQQVGVVIGFVVDYMSTAIQKSVEMTSVFGESLSVYKTLFTEGPKAAMEQALALQERVFSTAAENADLMRSKFDLLGEELDRVSEEGYKQFEAFNNVTAKSAENIDDVATAGQAAAPVIENVADAAKAAAEAQRAHNLAVREAARALKEAEQKYKEYEERMLRTEAAASDAAQGIQQYINDSEAWLTGASEAAREYEQTLLDLKDAEDKLRAAGQLSADMQDRLNRARANAGVIRDIGVNREQGIFGGGVNNLEDVFGNAVRSAFNERNLGSFFRGLRNSFSEAFSRRGGEGMGSFIERSGNAILQGVNFAQRAISAFQSGDTALQGVVNVLMMIPGPIGIIAGIVNGINAIAGGRLLGTGYERDSASRTINFGPGGAGGQDSIVDVRQRSFFRGRQWRETLMPLDAETQRTLNTLFKQVGRGVESAAELLGVETTNLVSAAFKQEFDKDGNLIKEFGTILGQTYNEGFEQFSQRIQAENLLAVLDNAFPSDGIQEIAERWREDAEELLAGTSALLAIGAEIKAGTTIFEGSLRDVLTVIEEFANPGEELLATYQRLTQTINGYAQTVTAVQEELLTANLSSFSRAVLQVRRQELQRIEVLNSLARSIGLVSAREEDLDKVRAASAARIQVLITGLTTDALDLVRSLYSGLNQPETPEIVDIIDPLPGALDAAAQALANFRQSVSDFMKGLEIDEQLSPFGAMERLQRARAMLREAAQRGDLQSAQQLASATLNIGRDLFASGRDYNALFEEVQSILSGVRFIAPQTPVETPTTPTRPQVPGQQDAANRLRMARDLAQAVADLAAEQSLSFEEVAANLGFNLGQLAADLGLSQDGLLSYLESLQADTVDLATTLANLPRDIARELAAVLQSLVPTEPVVGPGTGPGTTPGTGPGGGGGTIPTDPIGPGGGGGGGGGGIRGPGDWGIWEQYAERGDMMNKMTTQLDILITETRAGNRSNEEALQPIYDELQSQRLLMEDSTFSTRTLRA